MVGGPTMFEASVGFDPFPFLHRLAFFDWIVVHISDGVFDLLIAVKIHLPQASSPHVRWTLALLRILSQWMQAVSEQLSFAAPFSRLAICSTL